MNILFKDKIHNLRKARPLFLAIFTLFILLTTGCKDEIEKMELSEKEKTRFLQLQNPFGRNMVRFTPEGEKEAVRLGFWDCAIYRAKTERDVVIGWEKISRRFGGFYSTCHNTRGIDYEEQYARLFSCYWGVSEDRSCKFYPCHPEIFSGRTKDCWKKHIIYRTRDGKVWEKKVENEWKQVDLKN